MSDTPSADIGPSQAAEALFAAYPPPYDLRSDMLFVAALAPRGPLQGAFPGVPFLALGDRVPLVMWFSCITELCYQELSGERRCLAAAEGVPYNELNVVALLRRRAVFVPGIYATSGLSVRVAQAYGMPKRLVDMSFELGAGWLESRAPVGGRESFVRAGLLGSGRWSGRALSRLWPWQSWPVHFPGGYEIQAFIQATPRLQLARVQGRLALGEPWLPTSVALWPVGLFVPGFGMRLPPPPWRVV